MSKDAITLKANYNELEEAVELLLITNEYDYAIVKFDKSTYEYMVEAHKEEITTEE